MTGPRTLAIEPLTKAGFAQFGVVIERDGAEIRMINEGTTTRYHALSQVDAAAGGGMPTPPILPATPPPAGQGRRIPLTISGGDVELAYDSYAQAVLPWSAAVKSWDEAALVRDAQALPVLAGWSRGDGGWWRLAAGCTLIGDGLLLMV